MSTYFEQNIVAVSFIGHIVLKSINEFLKIIVYLSIYKKDKKKEEQ